jgi:hypothetical protein
MELQFISNFLRNVGLMKHRNPVAATITPSVAREEALNPCSVAGHRVPTTKPTGLAKPISLVDVTHDDDEAELLGATAESKARDRERARCAAILGSAGGVRNPVVARTLAFSTSMSRREAIATLDALPEPAQLLASFQGPRTSRRGEGREFA